MVYYDYYSKLASRKDNGEVRKEQIGEPLLRGDWSDPINSVFNPHAGKVLNQHKTVASFFDDPGELQKESNLDWVLEKQGDAEYITDKEWKEIMELVKASFSPRFIYATTFPNKIYINSNTKKGEVIELGKYDSGTKKITLYANAIREASTECGIPFNLLTTKVLLHELAHYIMDGISRDGIDTTKDPDLTAEESCANLIALICFEQLVKIKKIDIDVYNSIVRFMLNQPKEYQFGLWLSKENSWEWLKWIIFKQGFKGYGHKMETNDCILAVDGKDMFFKDLLTQNNN